MEDGLLGHAQFRVLAEGMPRVGVSVILWERAARDVEPDPVPLQEYVADYPEIDLELVDLAWCEERFLLQALVVASTDDALGEVHRVTVREDVDQLRPKVCVARSGGSEEVYPDWTADLRLRGQGRRAVDEHVVSPLYRPLVEWPLRPPVQVVDVGDGVRGVVGVAVTGRLDRDFLRREEAVPERAVCVAAAPEVVGRQLHPSGWPLSVLHP